MCLSEEPLSFYQKRQLEFEKQCRLLDIDINSDEAHSLRKSAANNNIAFNAAYTNIDNEVNFLFCYKLALNTTKFLKAN